MKDIHIQRGLPEPLRAAAASIYFDGFRRKLQPLLGKRDVVVHMLARGFTAANVILALYREQLVGLAGIQHGQTPFINLTRSLFQTQFGMIGGWLRHAIWKLASRPYQEGELLMDGIAVDGTMRGKGVGTRLLDAVMAFAKEHDYSTVRLDVIDTNPDARRLYERFGFHATKMEHYPLLKPIVGFGAVTTMVKAV